MKTYKIAVLPGDGIGPEVMAEAVAALKAAGEKHGFSCALQYADVGGVAIDNHGEALPKTTLDTCRKSDAILFGSVGGPKWESLPPEKQPERAALLPLRKIFDLFANLRPVELYPSISSLSPLKPEIISRGVDLLTVRELTSDIYFGQPKGCEAEKGFDTMIYHKSEVERIARVAFRAAAGRRKKVTSIDKANVLSTMVFWRRTVAEIAKEFPDIQLNNMYVDNAAMQMMINPAQFDVLLCGNMFGDILSDEASALAGSLGMLPSASINASSFGLYEPGGGSAPDIAGKGVANPVAQILSMAMMLEYSFKEAAAATDIRKAVRDCIESGIRTRDIGGTASTKELGKAVEEKIRGRAQ